MTPLRDQKTAQMPLVQFIEKLVEVTMIMRTSSSSPSTTENSGDASDSGSGSSWWILQRCRRQRHWQESPEGCRDDTGIVQGDEHALLRQMPNIKTISKTVEITHLVIQGEVPNVAKTGFRRRSSCRGDARQTIVQRQCPTPKRSKLGCSSAVQYGNEVVDMPVVKGRRADSDAQDAVWLLVTEVADSTALRSSARRTET